MSKGFFWIGERADRLSELWAMTEDGRPKWSASLIAGMLTKEFGHPISKNSIIGATHRLNLPLRAKGKTLIMRARRASVVNPAPAVFRVKPRPPQGNPVMETVTESRPNIRSIPFINVKARHCRAVLDQRGEDGLVLFCGAPKAWGSYCLHHAELYYQPPRGRCYVRTIDRARPPDQPHAGGTRAPPPPAECSPGPGDQPAAAKDVGPQDSTPSAAA